MCLGIPGKVAAIYRENDLLMGRIDFGGVFKAACLEHLPNTAIGDYVLIHVGFALARIDEAEARQVFTFLERMNELEELRASPASEIQIPDEADIPREAASAKSDGGRYS